MSSKGTRLNGDSSRLCNDPSDAKDFRNGAQLDISVGGWQSPEENAG